MKYNLSQIMKNAWKAVKELGMTISEGLKKAWKEAKKMEKTLREKVVAEIESIVETAKCEGWNYTINVNDWEKYGKSRTYFSVTETRNNSKHWAKYDFGFIDNLTDEYKSGKMDAFGKYTLSGALR